MVEGVLELADAEESEEAEGPPKAPSPAADKAKAPASEAAQ